MMDYAGLGGIIVLGLDLYAIISIFGSDRGTGSKVLWILLIIVLPILGFIIWLIAGPRAMRNRL